MRKAIARALLVILLVLSSKSSSGIPPTVFEPVPFNETCASIKARWVAPFVEYVESRGRRWQAPQVRWYSTAGELLARSDTLESRAIPFEHHFLSGWGDSLVLHGMYNDWHLPAPSADWHGTASRDGRVFVFFEHRERTTVGLDVYVQGQHAARIGSSPGTELASYSVGYDGSVGALLTSAEGSRTSGVLATNARGEITIDREAPAATRVSVAPNGVGLLLWQRDSGLVYLTAKGDPVEIRVDPAWNMWEWFSVWHPDSVQVVLGNGHLGLHAYADCRSGDVLWVAEAPPPRAAEMWVQPFADYVFQSGVAVDQSASKGLEGMRIIRVLDIGTGQPVAQWTSGRSSEYVDWRSCGRLMMRDRRLYYLANEDFSEIRLEDIEMAGADCCSWELPPQPGDWW